MAKTKIPKSKVTIEQNNFSVIKKYGGSVASQVKSFAKIRNWGDKNSAITLDGDKVERQEYYFCEGYGMVRTCPYELHFIYQDPRSLDSNPNKVRGRWAFMCTCGSIAGIVSYKELVGLLSPELGEYILVCNHHMATKQADRVIGQHADGSTE